MRFIVSSKTYVNIVTHYMTLGGKESLLNILFFFKVELSVQFKGVSSRLNYILKSLQFNYEIWHIINDHSATEYNTLNMQFGLIRRMQV